MSQSRTLARLDASGSAWFRGRASVEWAPDEASAMLSRLEAGLAASEETPGTA